MTTKEVITALKQAQAVIEAESDVIEEVHEYAHAYGCTPAYNVFRFLLEDAKRLRGQCVPPGINYPVIPEYLVKPHVSWLFGSCILIALWSGEPWLFRVVNDTWVSTARISRGAYA